MMKENEILHAKKLADLRKLADLYTKCHKKYGVIGIDTNSIHLVNVVETFHGVDCCVTNFYYSSGDEDCAYKLCVTVNIDGLNLFSLYKDSTLTKE